MKPGTIVITSRDLHEKSGVRLWDYENLESISTFNMSDVGIVIEIAKNHSHVKVFTSSGNIGWVLKSVLIPVQSCV